MWQWYRAMGKTDPMFRLKMPIKFYGVVRDQFSNPVEGAFVGISISGLDGSGEVLLKTTADGRFSVENRRGSELVVNVRKEGYMTRRSSMGCGFVFSDFFDVRFHEPDRNNPVVFELYRLQSSEEMSHFSIKLDSKVYVATRYLDVETGQVGDAGDFNLEVVPLGDTNIPHCNLGIRLKCAPGAGALVSGDEYLFSAPRSGYESEIYIERGSVRDGTAALVTGLYVKSRKGCFAAVSIRAYMIKGDVKVLVKICTNPSGSTNLESDGRH